MAGRQYVGQNLERGHPSESEVPRAVHDAHAAGAEQRLHAIVRNDPTFQSGRVLNVGIGSGVGSESAGCQPGWPCGGSRTRAEDRWRRAGSAPVRFVTTGAAARNTGGQETLAADRRLIERQRRVPRASAATAPPGGSGRREKACRRRIRCEQLFDFRNQAGIVPGFDGQQGIHTVGRRVEGKREQLAHPHGPWLWLGHDSARLWQKRGGEGKAFGTRRKAPTPTRARSARAQLSPAPA